MGRFRLFKTITPTVYSYYNIDGDELLDIVNHLTSIGINSGDVIGGFTIPTTSIEKVKSSHQDLITTGEGKPIKDDYRIRKYDKFLAVERCNDSSCYENVSVIGGSMQVDKYYCDKGGGLYSIKPDYSASIIREAFSNGDINVGDSQAQTWLETKDDVIISSIDHLDSFTSPANKSETLVSSNFSFDFIQTTDKAILNLELDVDNSDIGKGYYVVVERYSDDGLTNLGTVYVSFDDPKNLKPFSDILDTNKTIILKPKFWAVANWKYKINISIYNATTNKPTTATFKGKTLNHPWLSGVDQFVPWFVSNGYIEKVDVVAKQEWVDSNIAKNSHTGVITKGTLSINSLDSTKLDNTEYKTLYIDMSDPNSPIVDVLTLLPQSGVTPPNLANVGSLWIGIQRMSKGVGSLIFSHEFTALEKRSIAIIGRVWSNSSTTISGIAQFSEPAWGAEKTLSDLIFAIGTLNIFGNEILPVSNTLRIMKTVGSSFRAFSGDNLNSPNITEDAEISLITSYGYRLLSSNSSATIAKTFIDPSNYDNNGILTNISSIKFTIQPVYYYPKSNIIEVGYGQKLYNTLSQAIDGINIDATIISNNNRIDLNGSVLRAWICLRNDTTNLSDTNKVKFIQVVNNHAVTTNSSLWSTLNDNIYYNNGNVGIGTTTPSSKLQVVGLQNYINNSDAIANGLSVGAFYHTDGLLKVVI